MLLSKLHTCSCGFQIPPTHFLEGFGVQNFGQIRPLPDNMILNSTNEEGETVLLRPKHQLARATPLPAVRTYMIRMMPCSISSPPLRHAIGRMGATTWDPSTDSSLQRCVYVFGLMDSYFW